MNSLKNINNNPSLFKLKFQPALKILSHFTAFYILFVLLNLTESYIYIILVFSILTSILFYKKSKYLSFISLIILLSSLTFLRFKTDNFVFDTPYIKNQEVIVKGKVEKIIYQNERFVRIVAKTKIISKDFKEINSNVILSLINHSKGELKQVIPKVGNTFISQGYLSTFKEKQFPNEFPTKLYASSFDANISILSFSNQFTITNIQPKHYYYLEELKENIENQINYLFPKDVAKLIMAITIGKKNLLTSEDKEKYSLTGTSHIMAVSGLHVAVVATFLYFITIGFRNTKLKLFLNISLIVAFVVMTGFQDSAIRAGVMAIMILTSFELKKVYNIQNIFASTVLLFILIDPSSIFSISFQLSILALSGIVFYYSRIENRLSNLKIKTRNFFVISIITTISATFLLNPISAYYFQNFSLISLLANIYAIPLISIILICSIPLIILSFILPTFTFFMSKGIIFLVRLLNKFNEFLLQFDNLYFHDYDSIIYALVFLFITMIFIYFKGIKLLLIQSIFATIIILAISYQLNKDTVIRNNFDYEIALLSTNEANNIIVYDYNVKSKPELDFELYSKVLKDSKRIKLFFNGNNGQHLYDNLRDKVEIDTFKIFEKITF